MSQDVTAPPPTADPRAEAVFLLAAQHQAEQAQIRAAIVASILAAWGGMNAKKLVQSWTTGVAQRIFLILSMGQETVASAAGRYVEDALRLQGATVDVPTINALNFAGISSDGRDLESLLVGSVARSFERLNRGDSPQAALAAGANFLTLVASTQISDAGRAADQVALTAAEPREDDVEPARDTTAPPSLTKVRYGWVRMLTPPSCSRCAILAGQFYKWNDGFLRHPMCWPAGTVVSGPEVLVSSRRWYEGELVTIWTANREKLSVTANHPVLTARGWIPAKFLKEGDQVFRSTRANGASSLMVPNHDQMPTKIEDVFASSRMMRFAEMPSAPQDFHGDGGDAQVEIVFSERFLRNRNNSPAGQKIEEEYLALAPKPSNFLDCMSAADKAFKTVLASPTSLMGIESLSLPLGFSHLTGPHNASLGPAANLHICECEDLADLRATDSDGFTDLKFTHPGTVVGDDFSSIEGDSNPGARWDPSSFPEAMQDSATDTRRAFDLVQRLSGQVETDRIVRITRVPWGGHVYSLTTSEGWVSSNNLITSNCDCRHIPAIESLENDLTTNPYDYFHSLTREEQNRYFGVANSRAIREGGDINQIINATTRQGAMFTADDGRRYTREGMSRRGFARSRAGRVLRPTPWQIYRDARGSREEAVRLLREFGYIM